MRAWGGSRIRWQRRADDGRDWNLPDDDATSCSAQADELPPIEAAPAGFWRAPTRWARPARNAGAPTEGSIMDAKTGANIKSGKIVVEGKEHTFPIHEGTIGPSVLDISKLYAEAGMFTYDPGFTSTGSCESKITYIDGDEGVLLYRGFPIEQLAEHGDFLETCYLLLYGELPTAAQKAD